VRAPTRSDPAHLLQAYDLSRLRSEIDRAGRVLVVEGDEAARALTDPGGLFDAAWIAPEEVELPPAVLGAEVARVLRTGARVVWVVPGAWPLPAVLARALTHEGPPQGAIRRRVAGEAVDRFSLGEWRRALGPAFAWSRARALGLLTPSSAEWAREHPLAFGLLAGLDRAVGGWPVVRGLGSRIVLEGRRR
jgi:hypothetical protein